MPPKQIRETRSFWNPAHRLKRHPQRVSEKFAKRIDMAASQSTRGKTGQPRLDHSKKEFPDAQLYGIIRKFGYHVRR